MLRTMRCTQLTPPPGTRQRCRWNPRCANVATIPAWQNSDPGSSLSADRSACLCQWWRPPRSRQIHRPPHDIDLATPKRRGQDRRSVRRPGKSCALCATMVLRLRVNLLILVLPKAPAPKLQPARHHNQVSARQAFATYQPHYDRRHREHDRAARRPAGGCRKDRTGTLPDGEHRTPHAVAAGLRTKWHRKTVAMCGEF